MSLIKNHIGCRRFIPGRRVVIEDSRRRLDPSQVQNRPRRGFRRRPRFPHHNPRNRFQPNNCSPKRKTGLLSEWAIRIQNMVRMCPPGMVIAPNPNA